MSYFSIATSKSRRRVVLAGMIVTGVAFPGTVERGGVRTATFMEMREKLEELLSLSLEGGELLIMTHDNPDPDSIASAVAMRELLRQRRGVEATVAYSGVVGRAENRALLSELDLGLVHIDEIDPADFAHLAIVDAQPGTGNSAVTLDHEIDIVVDHHFMRDATREARFYHVMEGVGAASSIMTHYLRLAGVEIPTDIATALLYGIRSETQDLGRESSDEDRAAYQHLVPLHDPVKMAMIATPRLGRRYYLQLAKAIDSMLVGDEIVIAPMGEVTDPDFVPEMADLMIRMEGIVWSFAYGTWGDKMYTSIRGSDPRANAGEVMMAVLEGIGQGGGHGMRAGGNIDLGELKMTRGECEAELKHRFLDATGASTAVIDTLKASIRRSEEADESE